MSGTNGTNSSKSNGSSTSNASKSGGSTLNGRNRSRTSSNKATPPATSSSQSLTPQPANPPNNRTKTAIKGKQQQQQSQKHPRAPNTVVGRLLVLHGNRQTGDLLLGRLSKLRSTLLRRNFDAQAVYDGGVHISDGGSCIELVAMDAPFLFDEASVKSPSQNESPASHLLNTAVTPANDETPLRTWWHRDESGNPNAYIGLSESIDLVQRMWATGSSLNGHGTTSSIEGEATRTSSPPFIGLLGFSQGARLVHILTTLHEQNPTIVLPGLQFVIMCAGYDAPWPDNLNDDNAVSSSNYTVNRIPSLHVWGSRDALITPAQSQAVTRHYHDYRIHEHDGGHHVPMRAADIHAYVDFIEPFAVAAAAVANAAKDSTNAAVRSAAPPSSQDSHDPQRVPSSVAHAAVASTSLAAAVDCKSARLDDSTATTLMGPPDVDMAEQQRDEVEAIRAIFPDAFELVSPSSTDSDETIYQYPIVYTVLLEPYQDHIDYSNPSANWPPHPIRLHVAYPPLYPEQARPILTLLHDNNGMEFTSERNAQCYNVMNDVAAEADGMPCVMTSILAIMDFLSSPFSSSVEQAFAVESPAVSNIGDKADAEELDGNTGHGIRASSPERIRLCHQQGLDIAGTLLWKLPTIADTEKVANETASTATAVTGKGGSWLFSIGIFGKPSAGKSTMFNVATAFARQRQAAAAAVVASVGPQSSSKAGEGQTAIKLGGAAMAPHPFTTIEPNTGYALVPAAPGSCPEDNLEPRPAFRAGSSHGRDGQGRRLLPVLLKDVAGLVPGAYQGRGRGNQFLNDLCDTDVLIHVCDASGTADAEGNAILLDEDANDLLPGHQQNPKGEVGEAGSFSHPLNDMAWIRDELVQWVFTNLMLKWDTIRRKGRTKLAAMFSGYGQPESMTWNVLLAVEKYLDQIEHRERALDHLEEWDAADVHRLVSAFLGVRFPIALALNKADLPSSPSHIHDIQKALPIHGAHVGTPLSAKQEMMYVRRYMERDLAGGGSQQSTTDSNGFEAKVPQGTLDCLQSAIALCEPVLVFPIVDHQSYAPLPGLLKFATNDPSLPSSGMIACLLAAGGTAPSEWDADARQYATTKAHRKKEAGKDDEVHPLRDAIMMKPGSTVNDLFLTLKRLGALSGEFVRAEASGDVGSAAKPIPKHEIITRKNRIVKIMTNKRTTWQHT